jgi:hypothetical protein
MTARLAAHLTDDPSATGSTGPLFALECIVHNYPYKLKLFTPVVAAIMQIHIGSQGFEPYEQ